MTVETFGVYGPSGSLLCVAFSADVADAISSSLAHTAFTKVGYAPTYPVKPIELPIPKEVSDAVYVR